MSIELALSAKSADQFDVRRQENDARTLGMTGADIDIARSGSSFDFQLAKATAFALAPNEANRESAIKAGLDDRVCAAIEQIAASYMGGALRKST
ncbi:hypothetical protein AX760_16225 [Pararhizobium antarcticum]|uniref:Uncharacterized protein n=1 Tax=Pararhizobium antarcticum TaxID=1798805 RepID=A0A657LT34_9HYPH|nr:hypothetical protein AX760_16225 [Pararhizobium antarcticum]OJF99922.1 hypothetical protein AX761_10155 [Rhizobium sp. 58]